MFHKGFKFYLLCILMWPAAILFETRMHLYLVRLLWWMFLITGDPHISYTALFLNSWLPLAVFQGVVIGVIPVQTLLALFRAAFARFGGSQKSIAQSDSDPNRPTLWGWVLPLAVFVIRIASFNLHA